MFYYVSKDGILYLHVDPWVCISRVGCVEPYRTSAEGIMPWVGYGYTQPKTDHTVKLTVQHAKVMFLLLYI